MDVAKIFMTGRSQAVRLPKDYRFDDEEVCVARVDDMVILYPRSKAWDILAQGLAHFTDDFMADRDQPQTADTRREL